MSHQALANAMQRLTEKRDGFEKRIRELAVANPRLSVEEAVICADDSTYTPIPGPGASREANAEFVFNNPAIMEEVGNRKIVAIKMVRQLTKIGLKEAKEAVELADQWRLDGRMTRAEAASIDAEVDGIIASIGQSFAALREGASRNGIAL